MTDLEMDLLIANARITALEAQLAASKRREQAAVKDLRRTAIFNNSCAFCEKNENCDNQGPGRKSVELCWQYSGPQEAGKEQDT